MTSLAAVKRELRRCFLGELILPSGDDGLLSAPKSPQGLRVEGGVAYSVPVLPDSDLACESGVSGFCLCGCNFDVAVLSGDAADCAPQGVCGALFWRLVW